jgi:hypothetical protein
MDKYNKLTDLSRAYVVAIVLDPRQKYQYFYRQWNKSFHQAMKDKMESMFREFESSKDVAASSEKSQPSASSQKYTQKLMIPDWDIDVWRFGEGEKDESELDRYLKAPLLVLKDQDANDQFDPLEWWKGNAMEYLTLSRIAFEIFSIPAMSVELERVFSG